MVFLVHLEVLGESVDPLGEERNLDLRRTRIGLVDPELAHGVAEHDNSDDEQVLTESTDLPRETENTKRLCPACGKGKMVKVKTLEPTTDESFERLLTLARSPPLQRSA